MSIIDDFNSQFKHLRKIIDEIERQRKYYLPLMEQAKAQQKYLQPAIDRAREQAEFLIGRNLFMKQFSDMVGNFNTKALGVENMNLDFQQVLRSITPAIDYISSHIHRSMQNIDIADSFRNSFASDILLNLEIIRDTKDSTEIKKAVGNIASSIEKKTQSISPKVINIKGLYEILLAIFFFIWSQLSTFESEQNIKAYIKDTEDRLAKTIEILHPSEPDEIYVVTKAVRLRLGPATDSEILDVLQPNMHVTVLKKEKGWLYIEYFDYVDGETKDGWVYNRYFNKVLTN